jgi:hypothetical protein
MSSIYASKIKQVLPSAELTSAFAGTQSGIAGDFSFWDTPLSAVSSKFWDGVTIHSYPIITPPATALEAQEKLNEVLGYKSYDYIESLKATLGPTTPVVISEFSASATGSWDFLETLYHGIYSAEYVVRMSKHPNVKHVGAHALYMGNSTRWGLIRATSDQEAYLYSTYPTAVNTALLNFGFFYSANGLALQLVNEAVNDSTALYDTTLAGGAQVNVTTGSPIPALYAQAYQGNGSVTHVIVTNKSDKAHTVTINFNGQQPRSGQIFSMGNADPAMKNTGAAPNQLAIRNTPMSGVVEIPPYSVNRITF